MKRGMEVYKGMQHTEKEKSGVSPGGDSPCLPVCGVRVGIRTISAGERTPSHMHYHHSETWVVTSGVLAASMPNGGTVLAGPGESLAIPPGTCHVLYNPGRVDAVSLEIRVGESTSEEDCWPCHG